jgi:hypothetical protein
MNMKIRILTGVVLIFICSTLAAQFVGDGATKTVAPVPAASQKPSFTLKFGFATPGSNYGTTPKRNTSPQYSSGIMGAKTGFFAEMGMGMSFSKDEQKVGFYYFPILASYWQTSLDWKSLGGFFADKAIYAKPVSVIDIGQRYGIFVKPIKDLSAALYYRPGLVIPLKYEITQGATGSKFLFTGEMSTAKGAPIFMMSHTIGFSVRYMMATLSFEGYNTKPTYDVHYQDDALLVNKSTTGKIPIKMLLISLAINL